MSVGQAFEPAGSPDFPVRRMLGRLECARFCAFSFNVRWAGKPSQPADKNVCPTLDSPAILRGISDVIPPDTNRHLTAGFHHRDHLPHLKREGASYFVTFRLAGTLPREVLTQLKQEREAILAQAQAARRPLSWHEQEELFRWYSSRVDRYLDAGHGGCCLRQPEIAALVADALRFHAGQRFELSAWVVMPNHVHVMVRPLPGWTLSQILQSWKGFTAHAANDRLGRQGQAFWQPESFDHLVRDDEDLHRCCHYTTMNPVNAGLCARPEDWRWNSLYRETERRRYRRAGFRACRCAGLSSPAFLPASAPPPVVRAFFQRSLGWKAQPTGRQECLPYLAEFCGSLQSRIGRTLRPGIRWVQGGPKAPINQAHSKRFATVSAVATSRQRLECGCPTLLVPTRPLRAISALCRTGGLAGLWECPASVRCRWYPS